MNSTLSNSRQSATEQPTRYRPLKKKENKTKKAKSMKTVFLYGALTLIGFSVVVSGFDQREHGKPSVNAFHFENVTRLFINYINEKSWKMFSDCNIDPANMPSVFICLKDKYEANKDVRSKDPKKAFIGTLQLMKTSSECFLNVTMEQGLCLLKNKKQMETTVAEAWIRFGKIMDHILKSCNATPEMVKCVDDKKDKLQVLAKTMMNDPDVGETVWNLGDSLKTCLTSDPTIEKCALNKNVSPGQHWGSYGIHHHMYQQIKEGLMKVFGGCELTPENTPEIFLCLKKQYNESNLESFQDPKQMFMSFMRLINKSAVCYENVTNDQQSCISEKKKEVQAMFFQKMKASEKAMDQIFNACNVSESTTPEIVQCIEPKRSEMWKMLPQLFNNLDIAEPLWNLMESMKSCFDSKPEILKCFKGKGEYFMLKFQAEKKSVSKSKVIQRLKMMLPNCNISISTNKPLYECLKPLEDTLVGVIYRTDMDMKTKFQELQKIHESGAQCMVYSNEETKNCLAKQGTPLKDAIIAVFQQKTSGFDPKTAMASMDAMLNGCGISRDETPELMDCLDERTEVVMELKPWLPMSDEVREKLKEEGIKYWKCFQEKHNTQKECMFKIIEGFKKKGMNDAVRSKTASILSNNNVKVMINETVSKVLGCSKNQCFHKRLQKGFLLFKEYLKEMEKEMNGETVSNQTKINLRKNITKELVGAIFCLRDDESSDVQQSLSCIMNVLNNMMQVVKDIANKLGIGTNNNEENVSQRKKRDTEDEDEDEDEEDDEKLPSVWTIFTFFNGETNTKNDPTSVTVFQILLNDQNMEQVQTMMVLMRAFISMCTTWTPPPEDMRSRDLFENRKPVAMTGTKSGMCKRMYDEINSFIDTGKLKQMTIPKRDDDDDKKRSHVINPAILGCLIAVFSILFSAFVFFMARRHFGKGCGKGCGSGCGTSHAIHPSAPPQACLSAHRALPSNMPPSYNESLETEKYHPSSNGLSQILATSTKEGTEKSC